MAPQLQLTGAVEQTWLAIAASLLMGAGGVAAFIFAARRDCFHDLEEAKYQVFWSDIEELVESGEKDADGKDNTGA